MRNLLIALAATFVLLNPLNSWAVCSADIKMNAHAPTDTAGNTITYVRTPVNDTDIANKSYADAFVPLHMSTYLGSGTYEEAQDKCRNLTMIGFSDWRLPSLSEAVVGFANEGNSAYTVFHWTSTPYVSKNEWIVYIPNNKLNPTISWKTAAPDVKDTYHVRCVR